MVLTSRVAQVAGSRVCPVGSFRPFRWFSVEPEFGCSLSCAGFSGVHGVVHDKLPASPLTGSSRRSRRSDCNTASPGCGFGRDDRQEGSTEACSAAGGACS